MQSQESLKMEGEGSREFRMQPPDGGWGNVPVEEWLEVSWLYRRKGVRAKECGKEYPEKSIVLS